MPKPYVYIAGPFFTPEESNIIDVIESICKRAGWLVFSPKSLGRVDLNDIKGRNKIFHSNVDHLENADLVVAFLERRPDYELYCCRPDGRAVEGFGPIRLPDTGTVWELGVAYCKSIPVVGFVERPTKLNLMLTQSLRYSVKGFDDLTNIVRQLHDNERVTIPFYEGEMEDANS